MENNYYKNQDKNTLKARGVDSEGKPVVFDI